MSRSSLRGWRYAYVTSTLAVVVALSGAGAYAATQVRSSDIADGQVRSADLARSAVTATKVRNGSLRRTDVEARGPRGRAGGVGPAGEQGATGTAGPAGEQGPAGDAGAPGVGLVEQLPSGRTLRGAYAFSGYRSGLATPWPNDSGEATGHISFPLPLARVPVVELIRRKQPQNEPGDPTPRCPGSLDDPQAAPGYVCVYESPNADNVKLEAFSPYDDEGHTASRFGLGLFLRGPQDPNSTHRTSSGSWGRDRSVNPSTSSRTSRRSTARRSGARCRPADGLRFGWARRVSNLRPLACETASRGDRKP